MLAIDAYLIAIMAKNDILMSHGTLATPLPQDDADGDRIVEIVQSLVSEIDPSKLDPRPDYMGRFAYLFSGMAAHDGEDIAFVETSEPLSRHSLFFETMEPEERREQIIDHFGPIFWPDQVPAENLLSAASCIAHSSAIPLRANFIS